MVTIVANSVPRQRDDGSYSIYDEATVRRTKQSGEVWQFRMWIPSEGRYVRESLKTRDLPTALERGKRRWKTISGELEIGKKIFGLTLNELVQSYLETRKADVDTGVIVFGRHVALRSQCKHFLAFKGEQTRLHELDRSSLYDYARWRRIEAKKLGKAVSDETIKNEQSTFNQMIRLAHRSGHSHFAEFDFAPLRIREVSRRGTFTVAEYDELVRVLRRWCSKKEAPEDTLRAERELVRDFIYVASNTMMRIGELRNLRWSDVNAPIKRVDDRGKPMLLASIQVRAETSKSRKSRPVTTRGGQYLERIRSYSQFTKPSDYVFAGEAGDRPFPKKKLYAAWRQIMGLLQERVPGFDSRVRKITPYSLRHFGITCRLRAGATIYDIAKIVGNKPDQIFNHYGHFDQSMAEAVATKSFVPTKDGLDIDDDD